MLQESEEGSETSQNKAKDLLELLLQADIIKFAHFLVDVINVLSILSRVNQNRNSSIADIFATLESTLEMLQMYQKRWGGWDDRRACQSKQFDLGKHLLGAFSVSSLGQVYLIFSLDQAPKSTGWIQSHTFTPTASEEQKTSQLWET